MVVIGAVFARGGSKGIPGKNLAKIKNRTLTEIALKNLQDANICEQIYLCSDDDEILKEAKEKNHKRFKRNKSNCQDNSSEIDAWKELSLYLKNIKSLCNDDLLLIAPTTSPLRKRDTLVEIVKKLVLNKTAEGIICIKKSDKFPDFNLLRIEKDGLLNTYLGGKRSTNRQSCKPAWEMTTVAYCYRIGSILKNQDLFEMKTIGYEINFPETLDIDTFEDLELAKILFEKFNY
tara:strand:+ start:1130 stop:1828 length:699 start_codon:yes stop_codon:yes gene_type:complete